MPNPSFEEVTQCPTSREDMGSLVGWSSPTWGSPDIHHSCMNNQFSSQIPQNDFGWQWPRTGEAYCGFHQSDFDFSEGREYIQCELDETLENDIRYLVEFFVSRADSSTKANDNIGALFSRDAIDGIDIYPLPYQPQIVSVDYEPIIDDIGWVRISDTLTGTGVERYLTIGVFTDNASTNWILVDGGWEEEAHYFIDDVSVSKLSVDISMPNVFTPNEDGLNDLFSISLSGYSSGQLRVYNRWGRLVFSSSGAILEWDGTICGLDADSGVYFAIVELVDVNDYRLIEKGFVHLLR